MAVGFIEDPNPCDSLKNPIFAFINRTSRRIKFDVDHDSEGLAQGRNNKHRQAIERFARAQNI